MGPALAILEVGLLARGVFVADAVVKRAEVELLASRPVSGGHHLTIFRGQVEEAGEAFAAGCDAAGAALRDRLLLPMAHDQLWPLLAEPVHPSEWPAADRVAAAIVETTTVCAAIAAADAACKAADVILRDMRLAVGIAGKAVFTMTGELHDVEAAVDAVRRAADGNLAGLEIIPSPSAEVVGRLFF